MIISAIPITDNVSIDYDTAIWFLIWHNLTSSLFALLISCVVVALFSYIVYRAIAQPVASVLSSALNFVASRYTKTVLLELTPPRQSEKSPIATQQLFTVLHKTLIGNRSLRRRFIGGHDSVSVELASSKRGGIRYLIRTRADEVSVLQRQLVAYLPDIRIRTLDQPDIPDMATAATCWGVMDLRQTRHYAMPLQKHTELNEHDPIAYIISSMGKLQVGESIVMQFVLAPHFSWWTDRIYNKLLQGKGVVLDHKLRYFLRSRMNVWLLAGLAALLTKPIVGLIVAIIGVIISFFRKSPTVEKTQAEQQFEAGLLEKLAQPLFQTNIRIFIAAKDGQRRTEMSRSLHSSLATFDVPGFQELYNPRTYPASLWQRYRYYKFKHRLPSFLPEACNILSSSEISSLYHFPQDGTHMEDLVESHSRTLPASIAMKNAENLDVVLGHNLHHGTDTALGLTTAERERHLYIIGGTGNGKTTMIQYAIVQDIQKGKGVAVIDPHGDLAETILRHIPEERTQDIIYFNPDDLAHPIGLNLLELSPNLTGDELLREKDLVTESVVSIFRKIFSDDDTGGHRIEYVLRNTIQTALTTERPTLFTLFDLLNDPAYRKKVLATLEDKDLLNFWKNEMGKAGNFQQVKMVAGITSKIGRFLFSASAKRILEQPKSTINFDDILDGKILICNFSKGLLGEDTSELFGISVLAKLQMAALRRARTKQANRQPFYLYVDEFQNFATPSFVQMLSEARKYKLFLTMAEQSTSQQDDPKMVNIILANVGTVICFRSGNPADERLVLPLFQPYIKDGEIADLPAYNFYMRISAMKSQAPFSGETVLLEEEGSEEQAEKAIEASRKTYATKYVPRVEQPKAPTKSATPIAKTSKPKTTTKKPAKTPKSAIVTLPDTD